MSLIKISIKLLIRTLKIIKIKCAQLELRELDNNSKNLFTKEIHYLDELLIN